MIAGDPDWGKSRRWIEGETEKRTTKKKTKTKNKDSLSLKVTLRLGVMGFKSRI